MTERLHPDHPDDANGQRLAKRLAAQVNCSRREAEHYIEAGYVRVDGVVIDVPQQRVRDAQTVQLAAHATLAPLRPVTLLLHKPAGMDGAPLGDTWGPRSVAQLLTPEHRSPQDRSHERPLRRHFTQLICLTPLESGASGVMLFSQDGRVLRKLSEDAATVEHEFSVDVAGEISPAALAQLNRAPVFEGRARNAAKVSLSRQTEGISGLRFAYKGYAPGLIAQQCEEAGLHLLAIRRLRLGRLALAGLPAGEWRYLLPQERV